MALYQQYTYGNHIIKSSSHLYYTFITLQLFESLS